MHSENGFYIIVEPGVL